MNLSGDAFGASNFMREIVGYAPVEPDGSVKIRVPADVAFSLQVLDANGRNISPNLNVWLQAIPGEVVQCNGCHKTPTQQAPLSHGRSGVFAPVYTGLHVGNCIPTHVCRGHADHIDATAPSCRPTFQMPAKRWPRRVRE